MSNTKLSVLRLAACSAALLLGLVGCAPGTGDSASSEPQADAGTKTSSDSEHSAKMLAWELELAQCFRDNGLTVTDPTPEGGWEEITAEMQELSPQCQKEIGPAPVRDLSAAELAEMDKSRFEYETRLVECVRELGYDMPDPKLGATAVSPPADANQDDVQQCVDQAAA